MKTQIEKSFASRGLTVASVCQSYGFIYQTVWQHFNGLRSVTAEQAIKYERILGIPRSELRPDLWPPENWVSVPAAQEKEQAHDNA